MRNNRERIVRQPLHLGHGFRRGFKTIRNNGGGGYAGLFRTNGVVQTARRTAASITDSGDDRITVRHGGNDVIRSRPAGIRFVQTDDVANAVLRAQ